MDRLVSNNPTSMSRPNPVERTSTKAEEIAKDAANPPAKSIIDTPLFTGGESLSPVIDMYPAKA